MLESLHLTNFKAARDLPIRLGRLTLLAGLNGSGKSSVMQSLAVIRQSYVDTRCEGLNLGGPLVHLGRARDVLSDGGGDEISIAIRESGSTSVWSARATEDVLPLPLVRFPDATTQGFWINPEFQYLQADRILPRTLYPRSSKSLSQYGFLGPLGEFTVDYLSANSKQNVSPSRVARRQHSEVADSLWNQIASTNALLDQVAGWLQQISPGVHLQAENVPGTDEVSLSYRYLGASTGASRHYRPTNVGFGITYSLPIITACLAAKPGALVLIENPEAHLHPTGQLRMGELLAIAAADGVQIMVETHSDHVLNGIRLAVKRKDILHNDVVIHNFRRNISSGDCYTESPAIGEDGELSNWPQGFFDQWEYSLEELMK